jgi:hypothetical protein
MVGSKFFNSPFTIESSEPGILLSAKRGVRLIIHGDIVDVRHARLNLPSEACSALQIFGENSTGKAILAVVSQRQCVGFIASALDAYEGAKDFFPCNLHIRSDIGKNVWWK